MQSLSKIRIADAVLDQIVRQHFEENLTIIHAEELKEGYFNTAYRLDLSNGLKYVVKIAPPDSVPILTYERGILQTEVEAIRLARQKTEMPAPAIFVYDTSRQLVPSAYCLMQFLPGTPLHKLRNALDPQTQATLDREIGRLLRQLNRIEGPFFGYWAEQGGRAATWRAAFATMLKHVLDDGIAVQAVLPRPYDTLYAQVLPQLDVLEAVTTPQLVHWDLWDGNILVDPDMRQITGIIDFKRTLWGDPLMEVNFSDFKDHGAFVEGYGESMVDTAAKRQRRHLYNLYLYLIMVVEAYYRNYVEADITRWACERLEETLQALHL